MISNAAKNFDILAISLSVLHNYFNGTIKFFSDVYLVKFLNTSVKLFFSLYARAHTGGRTFVISVSLNCETS